MGKMILSLILYSAISGCTADHEKVTLSQYSFGMNLVHESNLYLTIDRTSSYVKFTLFDSAANYIAPSYTISTSSDSVVVYADELELKLVSRKQFQLNDSTYEVLKYEDNEREMTLFLNKSYGPLILRGNHYKGHETWSRKKRKERLLIDIIRNDSMYLGGV